MEFKHVAKELEVQHTLFVQMDKMLNQGIKIICTT
jgi:hypothetical protein